MNSVINSITCQQFAGSQGGKANILVCQLPVSQQRLKLDITVAPDHSGVGRAWKPDHNSRELRLLKPENQAPSVKRSFNPERQSAGLRSWG